jgi:hypothetical protein
VFDRWLSGLADYDDDSDGFLWGLNWIRSGSYENDDFPLLSDYNLNEDPNGVYENAVIQTNIHTLFVGDFEVTSGSWAPYSLASNFQDGPGFNSTVTNSYVKFENLNSIDIVFTADTSNWSRVCIVEAQDDPALAVGNQIKMGLRQDLSVNKEGAPDNSGTMGMGWFPGYAIDIETGERLNIIFAKNPQQK